MEQNSDYNIRTRQWLDETFAATAESGGYLAHEPVFGFGTRRSSPNQARRIARTARILQLMAREEFQDFLDVGAGEAYTADIVRDCFGVPVAACDLSREGCLRGRELFGVPTFACNAARLPLGDQAFDCVLCTEVIEHLEDPFAAMAELLRVARKAVIITTEECCHFELQRRMNLKLRQFSKPHLEINWWTYRDFPALLGPGTEVYRQIRLEGMPRDRETDLGRVKRWLRQSINPAGLEREGFGLIAIWRREPRGEKSPVRPLEIDTLLDRLIAPRPLGRRVTPDEEAWLRERLRCPLCRGRLKDEGGALVCPSCGREWPRYKGLIDLMAEHEQGCSCPESRNNSLNPEQVAKLRKIFSPENIWTGRKALVGKGILGATELPRDLVMGRGLRQSLRNFKRCLGEIRRELDPRAEGWLVRIPGQLEIYRIENGRKRHIVSEQVFFDLGYVYDQVKEVDAAWLDRFPPGDPLGPENEK